MQVKPVMQLPVCKEKVVEVEADTVVFLHHIILRASYQAHRIYLEKDAAMAAREAEKVPHVKMGVQYAGLKPANPEPFVCIMEEQVKKMYLNANTILNQTLEAVEEQDKYG